MQTLLRSLFLFLLVCLPSIIRADDENDSPRVLRVVDIKPKPEIMQTDTLNIIHIPNVPIPNTLVKPTMNEPIQLKPVPVQRIIPVKATTTSPIKTYNSHEVQTQMPKPIRRRYFTVPFWNYKPKRWNTFKAPVSRRQVYIRRRKIPVSYVIRKDRRMYRKPYRIAQWQVKRPNKVKLIDGLKALSNRIRNRIRYFGKKRDSNVFSVKGFPPLKPTKGFPPLKPTKIVSPLKPTKDLIPITPTKNLPPLKPIKGLTPLTPTNIVSPLKPTKGLTPLKPIKDFTPLKPINGLSPHKPIKVNKPVSPLLDKNTVFNVPKIRGARKYFQKPASPGIVQIQSLEKKSAALRPDNAIRLNSFMGRRRKS